jgi:hypothetical protein
LRNVPIDLGVISEENPIHGLWEVKASVAVTTTIVITTRIQMMVLLLFIEESPLLHLSSYGAWLLTGEGSRLLGTISEVSFIMARLSTNSTFTHDTLSI